MKELTKFNRNLIMANISYAQNERQIFYITNITIDWIKTLKGFKRFKDPDDFFGHYKSIDKLMRDLKNNYNANVGGDMSRVGGDLAYYHSSNKLYGIINQLIKY